MNYQKAPLFEALKRHVQSEITPFHVPAHKHGKGLQEMCNFLEEYSLKADVNAMSGLDDLNNPVSVIQDAQNLAADAFGAESGYFLINGTTSGIQAMFLSVLDPGDRVILPRNAHKSAFSSLILSGAVPRYAKVEINERLGIATMPKHEEIERCFESSPQTVALFLLNPNYYGFVGDLEKIFSIAREWDSYILVDEAHGGHFYFNDALPQGSIGLGADMSAVSMHKTCGSLTQSSLLLVNNLITKKRQINKDRVSNTLNMLNSTSASYLLMASIDVARREMMEHGKERIETSLQLAREARDKINEIDGLYAFAAELIDGNPVVNFDETKLCVYVRNLGMTGFEMERRLRHEYKIQVELSDLNNILALVSIGDDKASMDIIVSALASIAIKCPVQKTQRFSQIPDIPELIVIPRDAFYANKKTVKLENAANEICGEMIMSYPPGIPVVCPGERITQEIIDYITILKEHNSTLQGTADPYAEYIRVLGF